MAAGIAMLFVSGTSCDRLRILPRAVISAEVSAEAAGRLQLAASAESAVIFSLRKFMTSLMSALAEPLGPLGY